MDIPLTIIRYIPIVLFCLALTQPNMSQFTIRGAITDEDTFFCQHVANVSLLRLGMSLILHIADL